ncbi:MAG: hypothetical protein AABX29_04140 [Nanoarchaeota archaeon]
MEKTGKSKVSFAFDISGIVLIAIAIVIVKLSTNPLVEILAGVLATLGFGLIAGAKYV